MTTKSWLHLTTTLVLVGAIVAKLREMLYSRIPVGYQDETGFHFGAEQLPDAGSGR